MNGEFRMILDGNFDDVVNIFDSPAIADVFDEFMDSREKDFEFKMSVYDEFFNAISEFSPSIAGVFVRDSFLYEFEDQLKIRILFEAISRIFKFGNLNLENSIIEIIYTDTIEDLIDEAMEDAFQTLFNLPNQIFSPGPKMMS